MAGRRILVIHVEEAVRTRLRRRLEGLGHEVEEEPGRGDQGLDLARRYRPDVLFTGSCLAGFCGLDLAQAVLAEHLAPVVVIPARVCRKLERQAGALAGSISAGCDDSPALAGTVEAAMGRFALEVRVEELAERLETRKAVERAKGALMGHFGWDEATAHRWLQKRAMDSRQPQRTVAEAVLRTLSGRGTRHQARP
ncbi:putative transcriptional regulatory protein pdtaR [Candidatus Hydrogenisulfobacillus filiaventi]|uniref:Stage 0 sporulation protein A homolog n=1 Tax=Candidatus Hydrogenisulfobacillus filiaventi TaxID=2707344 RepID=A0A6F8ZDM0_9FIRM|nr:ANTAR domain-containing protein [Bacillota bacterium]CAB1127968.1 putative transcriptional regulatory protein pdtaR [Candidatus Hydrogenisulfobacillus filiaventi]